MKPRALIVDDSLTVRMNIDEALQAAGFETDRCPDLRCAREALARGPSSLIVLDVMLPDGDGLDFLAELRRAPATANVPVLLLSTEAEVASRVRGMRAGADEYVGKPYDIGQVVARALALVHAGADVGVDSRRRILVIDDSATFRGELAEVLEAAGYDVHQAATGEDGLTMAAAVRPHAVVVDGMMPGIDGATVVRRLKADTGLRNTPCILLTAAEDVGDEFRSLDAGADAYVRKSDDLGFILVRLAGLLRGATAGQAGASFLGPKRLLAVDDSMTYLQELGAHLRQDGYDIVLATSGEEALEFLATQSVDCILLDLVMPGLSGLDTCRRIKGSPESRDIPLVMLTARDDRATMIEGINAGADDYIAKSADFEVLKARLRAQLRRKHFEDENRRVREELVHRQSDKKVRMYASALERANRELESFSYSVAHDLRAPLRGLDGFSAALLEDYDAVLDDTGRRYLRFIRESARRMEQLIDDLLMLSRVTQSELHCEPVDLSALAVAANARLQRLHPERTVTTVIRDGLTGQGDARLLGIVFDNLFSNAWKYTSKRDGERVEFGTMVHDSQRSYFVRDNGAGFDMTLATRLFGAFQRLHTTAEFEGTGVGLATVQRIIHRHGGRVWAEGAVNRGATFYFTLGGSPDA